MDTVSTSHNVSRRSARWSVRLSGGFELIELSGGGKVELTGKRDRVLIAYLALSPKGSQPRRKLATLLWGDANDETALDNLRVCIWSLRKALGDTEHRVIAREGEDIVLDAHAFEVDVLTFRRLAAQSGRPELEEAAKLHVGDLLEGLSIESEEFESWRRGEAARFRDQAIDVLRRLMMQLSEAGETDRAIDIGTRILRLEPLHEAAVRSLMRLYGESGRRGTAVQLYRTLAEALKKELGAEPEAETRALFAEVSRGGNERTPRSVAADARTPPRSASLEFVSSPQNLSPPAQQAGDDGLVRRPDTRPLDGVTAKAGIKPSHDKWRAVARSKWSLAGGLFAAMMAALLLYQFASSTGTTTARQQTGVEASAVSPSPTGTISIAVLPFANLSGDASQEFFSDGMTEEIITALAKIPDLQVVARASAFQFKGQNRDIRGIGQALRARYVIDGSVRRAGDRVRIAVQLIQADNGVNVWADSFDRELTDMFAIQEQIAQAIAGALRMPLGLQPRATLVSNRGIDPESYEQYLRTKAALGSRVGSKAADLLDIMEQVVARNPDYAPAWATLSAIYRRVGNASRQEAAARRAIELDPNLADGYAALGVVELGREKWLLAEDRYKQALALDPSSVLFGYGNLLGAVGRLKEALAIYQRLRALEPLVPVYNGNLSDALWLNGHDEAALAILKDLPGSLPGGMSPGGLREMAMIHAAAGRYKEAADAMEQLSTRNISAEFVAISKEAARLLRTAPAKYPSPQDLPRLGPGPLGGLAGFVYLYIGAEGRALEEYEERGERGFFNPGPLILLWHPSYAPVRKMERFKTYVRKAGLVEYWRARGWPEFCRPVGADDFVCD